MTGFQGTKESWEASCSKMITDNNSKTAVNHRCSTSYCYYFTPDKQSRVEQHALQGI
jgi:hypothetical protein